MSAATRFVTAVDDRLAGFLGEARTRAAAISDDATRILDVAEPFVTGGKRVRASFVHWGWHAIVASREDADHLATTERDPDWPAVVSVAAGVELFHAAALVHDDIIDASDTRRGAPSTHRALETVHRDAEWAGDAAAFGVQTAIIVGDLMLAWADDLVRHGVAALPRATAEATMQAFADMREHVGVGQFLDVLEESAWIRQEPATLLARAHTVAVFKAARYTVEAPLVLGATMAGADESQLDALRDYGIPIGTAYQMRDDILGVFGDPAVTGKPAGDDLREGKRTVLVELARQRLQPNVRVMVDELLGEDLDDGQIALLQRTIAETDAVPRLESMIERAVGGALESLRDARLSRGAVLELERLAAAVTDRDR